MDPTLLNLGAASGLLSVFALLGYMLHRYVLQSECLWGEGEMDVHAHATTRLLSHEDTSAS